MPLLPLQLARVLETIKFRAGKPCRRQTQKVLPGYQLSGKPLQNLPSAYKIFIPLGQVINILEIQPKEIC